MSEATRRSYDRVAVRYAAEISGELAGKPLDRALLNTFAEMVEGPVLDAGDGPGHVADYLVQRALAVVSTDVSLAMCGLASQTRLPSVGADMTALPFGPEVVGGIVCLYAGDSSRRGAAGGGLRVVSARAADGRNRIDRVPHP
ncbi:MAG: hypothetical protein M3Y73_08010 [Actinomycetota bacterium]|nr:hypothetical protein [Actinomycetota bacterium]